MGTEAVTKRAEVVTEDDRVAEQFREYLERLDYDVEVKREVGPTLRLGVDIIVYHVSHDAAEAERRHKVRPETSATHDPPVFWLDAVYQLFERAPQTPILVAVPAGDDAADKALDSGATDVIEEMVTQKIFRRRLEMLEAFSHASPVRRPTVAPSLAAPGAAASPTSWSTGFRAVPLPSLRHERSGRIDAQRVADYLRISLRQLCRALGLPYPRVHKTPDAVSLQAPIAPIVRILELADQAFGSREAVLMWMNRPLYELEDESPLAVILAGEGGAVETLLDNVRAGIPG